MAKKLGRTLLLWDHKNRNGFSGFSLTALDRAWVEEVTLMINRHTTMSTVSRTRALIFDSSGSVKETGTAVDYVGHFECRNKG